MKGVKRTNDITVEDLTRAENVIKNSQESEFKDLTKLERLDPIKDDDNLIRVGGRLKKSMLPREIKHPVILPNKGELTRVIVRDFYQRSHHQGRRITLNTIRCAGF